jgi:hypothetical protein
MKPFRTNTNLARDILAGKDMKPTIETPMNNPEAEQKETAADIVMRKYCTKGTRLAQVKSKIIDNP